MRDAASVNQRFVALLVKGVITPTEFGVQAILEQARQYAAQDYLV